jgi:poly(3-hydroxybutyrate) depolymerase
MSRCSCTLQPASACQVSTDSADVPTLVSMARTLSANHMIDDVAGITSQRIVTISGAKDGTVPSRVVALAMFADQQGVQMRAIRNMIEQLTSGAKH